MPDNPYARAVEERDLGIFDVGSSPIAKHITPDSCRQGLQEAGARRALADHLRAEAMLDLAEWVQASIEQGLPITEIAELAGVTRQTVYDIVGRSRNP